MAQEIPLVLAGDYNVIPQDADAKKPEAWREDALALPDTRRAYRRLLHLGLTDALRARTAARKVSICSTNVRALRSASVTVKNTDAPATLGRIYADMRTIFSGFG